MAPAKRNKKTKCPVVLVVLDGWGVGRDEPGNAVLAANTPNMDALMRDYPSTVLLTSGEAVGLPAGQMGNSEVGHLNLGAGRIVHQSIARIDNAIADGSFQANQVINEALDRSLATGGALHLIGLIGDGGVHAHSAHLFAILGMAAKAGQKRVYIHAITDGRDTSPNSAAEFMRELQDVCQRLGMGRVAVVSGRYFAMDRDNRWERTESAFRSIAEGQGPRRMSALAAIEFAYANGVTDEFIQPTVIVPPGSDPVTIKPNDEVIFFNFRSDRGRQLTRALADPAFGEYTRPEHIPATIGVTTLTLYDATLPVHVALEPHDVDQPIAKVISDAGMRQFHCAETEKYAHVTFFFNGGREVEFAGESRLLVPSPKVATYDLQPEMSAPGVTEAVAIALASDAYNFVIVNFANCDMVGHTGVFNAAVTAVETVDRCLGEVVQATLANNGTLVVTADHGNAEEMIDRETGLPMTAHTTNPVPVVLVTPEDHPLRNAALLEGAILSAVTPTLLHLLGLEAPAVMTTPSLVGN